MIKSLLYLAFPLSFCLLLLFVGFLGLILNKLKKLSKIVTLIGLLSLYLLSNRQVSQFLLNKLESPYPPLRIGENFFLEKTPIHFIVVLGGGTNNSDNLPISSRLNPPVLARLLEGIRLYQSLPGTRLILSGGGRSSLTDAEAMARLATLLKVPSEGMMLESKSINTYDEAVLLKETLGQDPFILVTSARHMVRAMALFRKQGMNPVPAPTNYLIKTYVDFPPDNWVPNIVSLEQSSEVFYEAAGLLKEKLLGHL